MADKYKATLEGIELQIQDISDSFKKSIVKYESPFLDGARLEDMGQKARTIRFRCFFYEDTYETHEDVLFLLEIQDFLELHHPKYGIIKGSIESLDIHHDSEKLKTAEIDIAFVEHLRGEETPTNLTDIGPIIEESFIDSKIEQMKELETDVLGILGEAALDILGVELDFATDLIDQYTSISGRSRMFLSQVSNMVNTMKGTLNRITNPIRSILTTYDYLYNTGSDKIFNLLGYVMKATSNTMERYSLNHNSRKIAPARFTESFIADVKTLKDVRLPQTSNHEMKQAGIDVVKKHVQTAMVQQVSLDVGYMYEADEKVRQSQKKIEKNRSFDAMGRFQKPEIITPQAINGTYSTSDEYKVSTLMTVNEIERVLANVKTEIQISIDDARAEITLPVLPPVAVSEGMESESKLIEKLKEFARQLFQHANEIKLEREKIIQVEIENGTPLHLICLMYGLDYNTADRIHAINDIKAPNFTKGKIKIYAR